MNTFWTPERVTRLEELWREGMSPELIGKDMGTSKNAVFSKAHRMRLGPHPSPIRRGTPTSAALECINPGPEPIEVPPPGYRILPRATCTWIYGERGKDFALYVDARRCDETVLLGSSYCPTHHARCHKREVVDSA